MASPRQMLIFLTMGFIILSMWQVGLASTAVMKDEIIFDKESLLEAIPSVESIGTDDPIEYDQIIANADGEPYLYIGPIPDFHKGNNNNWVDATPYLAERGLKALSPPMNSRISRAGRDNVGDQKNLWSLNYGNGRWQRKSATCRSVGDNCFIYVETGANYNQGQIDNLENEFNNTIYPTNRAVFGPEPDVDGIHQITIFLYNMDGAWGTGGYFTSINEVNNPNSPYYPYSNHMEMFYVDLADLATWGKQIAAHEFQHMIHYNGDFNEANWINEGCSDLAIIKNYGFSTGVSGHINSFKNNHDKDLTVWGQTNQDYGASAAFMDYLEEHFGGNSFIKALVDENSNSINGINKVLAAYGYEERFIEVFKNWTIANKLDDPSVAGGVYNYRNITLRIPDTGSYNDTHYPLGKTNRNVNHWAADYYRFTDGIGMLEFSFNGNDAASFALTVIKEGAGGTVVEELSLDSKQDGDFGILGFGPTYTDMVLVVACVSSGSGKVSYSFSADTSNKPVIIHEPLENNNNIDGPHDVKATIVDPDYNLNVSSLRLYYNKNGSRYYTESVLNNVMNDDYSAQIPGPSNNVTIFYYLLAADEDLNQTTSPFSANPLDNSTVHSFIVVPDHTPPIIQHLPLEDTVFNGPFEINSIVTDDWFLDLDSISLYYNTSSSPAFQQLKMEPIGIPNQFRAYIPMVPMGESVFYYFTAQDHYKTPNSVRLPVSGYFSFRVLIPAGVLLVDDDAAGNYTSFDKWYRDALNYTSIAYDSIRVPPVEDGPNATILNRYDTVIWETGDEWGDYMTEPESGRTLTNGDLDSLTQYLDHGGNLLLSGSFIGLELRYDIFFSTYFHMHYKGAVNYTGSQSIYGIEDDRIGDNITVTLSNRSSDSIDRYMCNYSVSDGAEVIFTEPDKKCDVGFRINDEDYRAVYLSFAFEEISQDIHRNMIMARVLEFLSPNLLISHTPLGNTVDVTNPYNVEMSVESEDIVEFANLVYSTDGATEKIVPMVYSPTDGTYSGNIPAQQENATVYYYIMSQNGRKCRGFHPADLSLGNPDTWNRFIVFANDFEPPFIVHEPKFDVLYVDNYTFYAYAGDNVAINRSSFMLEYTFDSALEESRILHSGFHMMSQDVYIAHVGGPPGNIYYRILVADVVGNIMTFPVSGFYELDIYFHDNLERDILNWSFPGSQNTWELTERNSTTFPPLSLSGATFPNDFFISTGASSNYPSGVDSRIITPPIDLTRAIEPELTFYMWANLTAFNGGEPFDQVLDEVILEVYDKSYSTIATYNHSTLPVESEWIRLKVDLSKYSGKIIRLCWHIIDRDPTAQSRGVALDFIKIKGNFNNTSPGLHSHSVYPESGFNDTLFTFNVTYADLDNDWAEYVALVLDETLIPMSPLEDWDNNFLDGKNYSVEVLLFQGNHSYRFIAQNLYDEVSTGIIQGPTVHSPNSPPVFTMPDLEVFVGHQLTYTVKAIDPDNDTLFFLDNSSLFDIDDVTGMFSLTPGQEDVGSYHVGIGVGDWNEVVWQGFNLTVLPNSQPTVTTPGNLTAYVDIEFNITILATDLENDSLSFSSSNPKFNIGKDTGEMRFTPTYRDIGRHEITVEITDGITLPVTIVFNLDIVRLNLPPLLLNISVTPKTGNESTRFFFTAVYLDEEDGEPEYIRVYIDNESFNMTEINSDAFSYDEGLVYQYKGMLEAGNHSYYFECKDDSGADNAINKSPTHYIYVNIIESNGEVEQDGEENEGLIDEYLQWIILGFILFLAFLIIMMSIFRRKKRNQKAKELEKKLSSTMSCPVCKAEIGKYETVCPNCDYRLSKRSNIYKKKDDYSNTMTCPGCYSKVSTKENRCPYCKIRLERKKQKKEKEDEPEIVNFTIKEEPTLRYKKPVTRKRTRKRRVKKEDKEPEAEINLVFKRPEDYPAEGDDNEVEGNEDFDKELAKIVGESIDEELDDSHGEFEVEEADEDEFKEGEGQMKVQVHEKDQSHIIRDEIWEEESFEYDAGELEGIWDSSEEPGDGEFDEESSEFDVIGHEGIWDGSEEPGGSEFDEESFEFETGELEGTWDSDEEDSGGKSFQWLDPDEMGQDDEGEVWDDDEFEIRDTFVLSDDDTDEDRKYAEAVFEVFDSYGEAGDAIALWDEDEAEEYFEIIEEAREEKPERALLTKKKLKKKGKKGKKKKTRDDNEYTADWDD